MECRCHHIPNQKLGSGELIVAFDEPILMARFVQWFESAGFSLVREEGGFRTQSDEAEAVLTRLCRELELPDREKEGVKIAFLPTGAGFGPDILKAARSLRGWCASLQAHPLFEALRAGRVDVHFQPIVDAIEGKLYGHEALMRFFDEKGQMTGPLELIEAARESNTLFHLDRLARESALRAYAAAGAPGVLFINFLPTAIYNPALCLRDTFGWASELGLDFSRIVFEVVESEQVEDLGHLDTILKEYRAKGFKTALDDVGNDYDSLSRLGRLGADIVKIDRAFVHGIAEDPLRQELFKTLYTKAKSRGMEVLAEGVELEADYRFLRMLSVRLFQGYLFGKPQSKPLAQITLPA
jgi:EAL domain-containing protein (putative c-di-GMP-specific phosphodiesterase class I)